MSRPISFTGVNVIRCLNFFPLFLASSLESVMNTHKLKSNTKSVEQWVGDKWSSVSCIQLQLPWTLKPPLPAHCDSVSSSYLFDFLFAMIQLQTPQGSHKDIFTESENGNWEEKERERKNTKDLWPDEFTLPFLLVSFLSRASSCHCCIVVVQCALMMMTTVTQGSKYQVQQNHKSLTRARRRG